METPLLRTKLYIPPPRLELVQRPHLIERLNTGLQRKLTLISAPAGFGKTTLVSEWVQALGGTDPPIAIAWLSLDESDNDLTRFLTYLIGALQTIEAGIGKGVLSALQSPQPLLAEEILTALINEIAALACCIVLVLDDYHLIDTQPIHDALAFLLRRLPPQMHLVITTRVDPPLPLARLRVRGQLTELRAGDLCFTSSEATEFLNQTIGLNLSPEDIAALGTRTEGWIAGLQLAAISMQRSLDAKGFIQSFTGSHRYVLDYLIEEVLNQQSGSIQTFLLYTSILDRLAGPLCDAVRFAEATSPNRSVKETSSDATVEDGQSILEMLEQANLFITPLDNERRWYRYHHLFADLLRQRLRQTQPERIPTLHQRASEWCERNGLTDEATEHALRAQDFEHAAHLITKYADAIWKRGEHDKLLHLLNRLPVELIFSNPHLCIFYAWYSFIDGQQDVADQSLQAVEQAFDSSALHSAETESHKQSSFTRSERMKLRGRVAAVRAFIGARQGDVQKLIPYAHQALEYLPKEDHIWRSMTALSLGDVYGFKGDMTAAYAARFEAYKACKANGDTYYAMLANMKLAITLRSRGQLRQTVEICHQQIQMANASGLSKSPLKGLLLAILGEVLVELNDLDQALNHAMQGIELAVHGVDATFIGWAYMCLMRIKFSRGEFTDVEKILQKVESIAQESNLPPWIMNQMVIWQTRVWLVQGRLEEASHWAVERSLDTDDESKLPQEIGFFSLFEHVLCARILIAQGRFDPVLNLLSHLLKAAETGGRTTSVIEISLLQALAYQAMGDTDQAFAPFERALALSEPEGFVRIFVDEGPPMARLLYEALSRGIAPDYVQRLLAVFPVAEPGQAATPKKEAPQSELIEPLSERELEVLQLLVEGLTNQEIASKLYLALNTVKSHARNIYGKLNVHSRTQAVARAQVLGLLPRN